MKIKLSKSQWQLIGQKTGWIRLAGENYTEEIASSPNTSPEILKKILEKGKDDSVSRYAVQNPNCPPEALAEVLKRGQNDIVSRLAASNPNCPPEALEMILNKGINDDVSYYAANNPNCPEKTKTDWMRLMNRGISNNNESVKNLNQYIQKNIPWK